MSRVARWTPPDLASLPPNRRLSDIAAAREAKRQAEADEREARRNLIADWSFAILLTVATIIVHWPRCH